ncbi:MAG: DUF2993 domain-containing protein [Glaciihabitans sp.]
MAGTDEAPTGRRPRRRLRIWLIVLVTLLVLAVIALVVGERLARDYAAGVVREKVATALNVPDPNDVGVSFGEAIFLLQVVRGSIDEMTVDIDSVDLGELSGAATAVAHGVPIDGVGPVGDAVIDFTIPEDKLTALASTFTDGVVDRIGITDSVVSLETSLDVLTFSVPISLGFTPSADAGDIVFTPASIELNGATLTAEQVREGPFAGVAAPLLAPRPFCVASELPEALTLDDAAVANGGFLLTFSGTDISLNEADLAVKGTC